MVVTVWQLSRPAKACALQWRPSLLRRRAQGRRHTCIYIYIYMYTHMYVHIYIYIYIYTYIGDTYAPKKQQAGVSGQRRAQSKGAAYISLSLCIYIYIYICIHKCISLSLYISIYTYIHTCIYIYIYRCIYISLSLYLSLSLSLYIYVYIYVYIHTSATPHAIQRSGLTVSKSVARREFHGAPRGAPRRPRPSGRRSSCNDNNDNDKHDDNDNSNTTNDVWYYY